MERLPALFERPGITPDFLLAGAPESRPSLQAPTTSAMGTKQPFASHRPPRVLAFDAIEIALSQ
jgi:hypothetical protein